MLPLLERTLQAWPQPCISLVDAFVRLKQGATDRMLVSNAGTALFVQPSNNSPSPPLPTLELDKGGMDTAERENSRER